MLVGKPTNHHHQVSKFSTTNLPCISDECLAHSVVDCEPPKSYFQVCPSTVQLLTMDTWDMDRLFLVFSEIQKNKICFVDRLLYLRITKQKLKLLV